MYDIYLDNAATTKPFREIEQVLNTYIDKLWYNPSAMYRPAVEAEKELSKAREIIGSACNAESVLFTSCGTESNNMVILHGYKAKGAKKLHFITSVFEHPAAYNVFQALESMGHSVTYISPGEDGIIHAEDVAAAVREDTALVSIMHVNNESGACNDIVKIAAEVKKRNPETLFHSDGVQGFLKCAVSLKNSKIDYYSVSAHKVNGLKGTGALLFKKGTPLKPYLLGGGQEKGLRSGTENLFGILAFQTAVENHKKHWDAYLDAMWKTTEQLKAGLMEMDGVRIITPVSRAPHLISAAIEGIRGETLLHVLEEKGIYISVGSACSSKKGRENRLKTAFSLTDAEAEGVIRLSVSPFTTEKDIEIALENIKSGTAQLRKYLRR